jgi:hypothetical protein
MEAEQYANLATATLARGFVLGCERRGQAARSEELAASGMQ